jgi:hypothetical protein
VQEDKMPLNILVRSIASIVERTERWESCVNGILSVASSQLTPKIAVQVIKRIHGPKLSLKFFEWLELNEGFHHDAYTFSAIIKVLTKKTGKSGYYIYQANSLLEEMIGRGFVLFSCAEFVPFALG